MPNNIPTDTEVFALQTARYNAAFHLQTVFHDPHATHDALNKAVQVFMAASDAWRDALMKSRGLR